MAIKKKETVSSAIVTTFPSNVPGGITAVNHRAFLDDEVDSAIYGKQFIIGRDLENVASQWYRLGTLTSPANFQGSITVQTLGNTVNGNSTVLLDVTVRATSTIEPVIAYTLRNEANTAAGSLTGIRAVGLSAVTSPDVAIDILLAGTVTVEGTVSVNIVDSSEVEDGVATFTADTDMTAVDATITSPEFLIPAPLRPVAARANLQKDLFLASDIDNPLVAATAYVIKGQLVPVTASFSIPDISVIEMEAINRAVNNVVYVVTSPLFAMENSTDGYLSLELSNLISIDANPAHSDVFDVNGTHPSESPLNLITTIIDRVTFLNHNSPGTMQNIDLVVFDTVLFNNFTVSGFKLINIIEATFSEVQFSTPTPNMPIIEISGLASEHIYDRIIVPTGSPLFRIDPAIPDDARISISRTNAAVGALLFDTTGTTGTFTSATQVDVAANISSVGEGSVRSGGNGFVARFFFDSGSFYKGQKITLSNFSGVSAYNATGIITETSNGGFLAGVIWFEIFQILEAGTDTGDVTSVSARIVDTGTVLEAGDTIVVSTDLSTDYDGGTYVYAKQTNSFRINRAFTSTHTGTWSTASLDQKDPRVLARDNPDFVNNNLAVMDSLIASEFNPLNFTTGISDNAFKASDSIELWKLIDQATGTFIYIGNEPFDGAINFSFTLAKGSGSSVDYDLAISKSTDDGVSFTPLEAITSIKIGNTETKATSLVNPLTANKGDLIRGEINPANTDTVAATFFSMFGSI